MHTRFSIENVAQTGRAIVGSVKSLFAPDLNTRGTGALAIRLGAVQSKKETKLKKKLELLVIVAVSRITHISFSVAIFEWTGLPAALFVFTHILSDVVRSGASTVHGVNKFQEFSREERRTFSIYREQGKNDVTRRLHSSSVDKFISRSRRMDRGRFATGWDQQQHGETKFVFCVNVICRCVPLHDKHDHRPGPGVQSRGDRRHKPILPGSVCAGQAHGGTR